MNVLDSKIHETSVLIPFGPFRLPADLVVPVGAAGVVIFAHGSGSSRLSPRNQSVAGQLQEHGLGTLLFDLLTGEEEAKDSPGHLRFDISLLAERLMAAREWISREEIVGDLPLAYFGSSTGAAAALVAAAIDNKIHAIVSRGGRPDLAGDYLGQVQVPVLLIVGGEDGKVIGLNEKAREKLRCKNTLSIIPGASHLFEEPGTLEEVSRLASEFFLEHFHAEPKTV